MKGKIIAIEGLDGSGKSTQIELLTQHFEATGLDYRFVHFPMLNKGRYGTLIAEFLRGEFGALDEVHPKLVALLFANDRHEFKGQLQEWMDQGMVILMDRYVNSNIAFQCAKCKTQEEKNSLKEWILDFEFNYLQLPRPEVSFFLNVPLSNVEKSLQTERTGEDRDYLQGKTDIREDSFDFQKNVYTEYRQMVEEQADFELINCTNEAGAWLDPKSISQLIIDGIQRANTGQV